MEEQQKSKSQDKKSQSLSAVNALPKITESGKQRLAYRYSVAAWMKSRSNVSNSQPPVTHRHASPDQFISRIQPAMKFAVPVAKPFSKKVHKVKVLIWADLTLSDIERLDEHPNYERVRHLLADIFSLGNYKQNLKSSIVLDLYYYTLQFARQQHFSPQQTSAFFSITKRILEVCQETPYGNLDYTYEYFKELLFCHCVNRPPMSIELFSKEEVIQICTYTLNTFFKHFKLYKYAFTPMLRLDLTLKYIGTSPLSPFEADVKEAVEGDEEEDNAAGEGTELDDIDYEKIQAQEELKRIVTDFLLREAKKIEGNVESHLKAAVDSLNAKIDPLLDTTPAKNVKGKKR